LDTHGEIANFHLYFLLRLTKYLGFYPDSNQEGALYFDLMEGAFTNTPSVNPMVMGENLHYFKMLLGIQFDGVHQVRMRKTSRQELLKSLVLYYELHLQGFRKPRSLAILNEVFN
jgi:DNA repair protein RecO (recombination protein O)